MATSVTRPPREGGNPEQPRITAMFEPIAGSRGAFAITVFSRDFMARALQLFARVGTQPVNGIIPFDRGGGFTGVLEGPPHEGDRLYIRYSGGAEMPTPVVYHGGNGGRVVA